LGATFLGSWLLFLTLGELTREMIQEYLSHHFEKDPDDKFDIE